MVTHSAVSIDTAETRTGVLAMPVDTGKLGGTISIDDTFRSTVGRASDHVWHARALASVSNSSGWQGVGPTGVWITGVDLNWLDWGWWRSSAGHERISNVALVTDADRKMVCHLTVSIAAAEAWTGVNTVLVSALLVCWAVSVDDTFRPARHVRVAKVVGDAATSSGSSLLAADCIVTTWRWVAWINHFCSRWVCWLEVTGREGVTNISRVTLADGVVVIHGTCGMGATHTRTWVSTFVVDACLVGGAVWIDCALVLAFNVGIAFKTRQTDAGSCLVPFPTLRVDSTRRWVAWIYNLWANGSCWWSSTLTEGISDVALVTDADWHMVSHATISIDTTEARAWVLALASDASLVRGAVRVDDTLWPAVGWGADHIWEARTLAALTNYPRWVAVWTAWIRITWVNIFNNS